MKSFLKASSIIACSIFAGSAALADAIGGQFDVNDFYLGFELSDINSENQQTWPYWKYVSTHWDDYAAHGTASIAAAPNKAELVRAGSEERLDLTVDWRDGRSFLDSLHDTQVKGFIVMKDNVMLAEFYDNGFNFDQKMLLQSSSKSYAGMILAQLAEQGLVDRDTLIAEYLEDFAGTSLGEATVQQVLDMTSGLGEVFDFHTPGAEGYLYELEQGLKQGETLGHRKLTREAEAKYEPGSTWAYNDKCTDTLAMLAEQITGKSFAELMTDLFAEFGATSAGSIAVTSDGGYAPSYGISTTLRDYGLFHQWIAQGNAPEGYYKSLRDAEKDRMRHSDKASYFEELIYYGDQAYYMPEHDIIYSSGSMGQLAYSDMRTGVSVAFMQDWAINAELDKFNKTHARAIAVINFLRAEADPWSTRSRGDK